MVNTRSKIIMEALKCFLECDYEQVTLNQIAHNIDITKGAIYHYFASKDELLKEVVRFVIHEVIATYMKLLETQLSLKTLVQSMFSLAQQQDTIEQTLGSSSNQDNFNYLFFLATRKHPELKKEMAAVFADFIHYLESILLQAQERGEISSEADCLVLAYQLVALSKGTSLINFFNPDLGYSLLEPALAMFLTELGMDVSGQD